MSSIQQLGSIASAGGSGNSSYSASHTLQSGTDRIAIGFFKRDKRDKDLGSANISYGGVSMNVLSEHSVRALSQDYDWTQLYVGYLLDSSLPATGTRSFSISDSDTYGCDILGIVLEGAEQQDPSPETIDGTTSSTSSFSVNLNSVPVYSSIFTSVASYGNPSPYTQDTGYTKDAERQGLAFAHNHEVAGGNHSIEWSYSTNSRIVVGAFAIFPSVVPSRNQVITI